MACDHDGLEVRAMRCPQCGAELQETASGSAACRYCGSSLVLARRGKAGEPTQETVVRGMRLEPFTLNDPDGSGLPVLRMLVPAGWRRRGGVMWDLGRVGMPATVSLQVWDPSGSEAFEILPNMHFSQPGGLARLLQPTGSTSYGSEVRPPMGARAAMKELVIPRYRGELEDLEVLAVEDCPELAEHARMRGGDMGMRECDGARARVTYRHNGHDLEEEIFGAVEVWRTSLPTMLGPMESVFWNVVYLFSCRTARGQLDASADLFEVMLRSLEVNPQWLGAYEQVIVQLAQGQIRHTRQVGGIGSMLAASGAEMREQDLRDWYGRQAVGDRLSREWSEAIRGVESYHDPYRDMQVELPAVYDHAWVNGLGEHLVTDDPNLDPNVDTDSTASWQRMKTT